MGYYFNTIPKNIALMEKERYSLDMFVETGTFTGVTAKWASKHFFQVHTVELREEYYEVAEHNLLNLRNVTMYLNDSRNALPEIINNVGNYGTLFYLDAHWSRGVNYGRPMIDSVVIEEILLINEFAENNHVIIVDDSHRFGTENWPTKKGVIYALENNGKRYVRELLDVLIATPSLTFEKFKFDRRYIDAYLDAPPVDLVSLGRIRN